MSAIVSTVAPVFALILIGYLTTRWGAISQEAAKGLGEFAFVILDRRSGAEHGEIERKID